MNKQRKAALGFLVWVGLAITGFVFHEQILGMAG